MDHLIIIIIPLLILAGDSPGRLVGKLKPSHLIRDLIAVKWLQSINVINLQPSVIPWKYLGLILTILLKIHLNDDGAVNEDSVGHVEADGKNSLVQELQVTAPRLD